jgi:L-2-hydroxycarboxylate dehydrogenase (NAD+)
VASIGTSPIAIGIPGPGPQDAPLVLDMATSVAAAGRIRQAAAEGKAIPEGIAIDAHGKPSFGLSWAALRSSSVFRN